MKSNLESISSGRAIRKGTPVLVPRVLVDTKPFSPEELREIGRRFFVEHQSITRIVIAIRRRQGIADVGNNRIEDCLRHIFWSEAGRREADRIAAQRVKVDMADRGAVAA